MLTTVENPLVLDLDGTVLRTDTLVEQVLRLAATDPIALALAAPTLRAGRAAFKHRIAQHEPLDAATLVYNEDVLALAREARAAGRPVYLVTAADQSIADAIAAHLQLFDAVYASNGTDNLKGEAKAAFLTERFGARKFDYAGDAEADLAVWRQASRAIVVAPTQGLLRRLQTVNGNVEIVGRPPTLAAQLRLLARALRVHQWAKNILIFLPVFAAHRTNPATIAQALTAFVAFSLCASSVYVLNDLLDLPHDRAHPRKCRRPFASGAIPLNRAPAMLAACLGGGVLLALTLPWHFVLMLAVYYACTVTYSFGLKRRAVWDVTMLALLYTMRVFAGSAATGIRISPWLLAFSMFLFFALAVVKRQTELVQHLRSGKSEKLSGRGYEPDDIGMLSSMAASSGYMAVLVLALYVNSADVLPLYRHPSALWALCPALLFWVSRVLMLAHRGLLHDDPVVFALQDRISLMIGAVGLAAFVVGAW